MQEQKISTSFPPKYEEHSQYNISTFTHSFMHRGIVFPSTMMSLSGLFKKNIDREQNKLVTKWRRRGREQTELFWNDRHLQTVCDELPLTVFNPSTLRE